MPKYLLDEAQRHLLGSFLNYKLGDMPLSIRLAAFLLRQELALADRNVSPVETLLSKFSQVWAEESDRLHDLDSCSALVSLALSQISWLCRATFPDHAHAAQMEGLARCLVDVLAALPEAGAPTSFFTDPLAPVSEISGTGVELFTDSSMFTTCLGLVCELGLARLASVPSAPDDSQIVMHGQIQRFVLSSIKLPGSSACGPVLDPDSALWKTLLQGIPADPHSKITRVGRIRATVPVLTHFWSKIVTQFGDSRGADFSIRLSEHLNDLCTHFDLSEACARFAVSIERSDSALLALAATIHDQKHPAGFPEAENLLKELLSRSDWRTSARDRLVLDCGALHGESSRYLRGSTLIVILGKLANLLQSIGPSRYAEAEAYHRESLQMRIGMDSSVNGVHKSLHDLAHLLQSVGPSRYAEAEAYYRESLRIERELYSNVNGVHPAVAASLHNLAYLMESVGPSRYAEAEAFYQESLLIKRVLYSSVNGVHPAMAASLNNLANLLESIGPSRYAEAEAYHREALKIDRELYSSLNGVHPDVAVSLHNLAGLLQSVGPSRYAEAEAYYRESLQIFQELHSSVNGVHPAMAKSLTNFANLLESVGPSRYAEAEAYHRESLRIVRGVYSNVNGVHPDVARPLNNLANLLESVGPSRYAEAEVYHHESLQILREVYSSVNGVHPDVAVSLNNLTSLLESVGPSRYAEAEAFRLQSLQIEIELDLGSETNISSTV